MIRSFGNRLAEDVFDDRRTAAVRRLPPKLYRTARRKVLYLLENGIIRGNAPASRCVMNRNARVFGWPYREGW